jgi:hypothetical protein
MSDKEDQTNAETPPKYRALRNGTGYTKDIIFTVVSDDEDNGGSYGEYSNGTYYAPDGCMSPVLAEIDIKRSPDFERVEELWEPKAGETQISLSGIVELNVKHTIINNNSTTVWKTGGQFFSEPVFRTEEDAQSCLDEVTALIQKRSKESRRLG